jgi:hypothetical protein
MEAKMQHLAIAREPPTDITSAPVLGDLRFRALMSEEDWSALPAPIRRRFSKRLSGGNTPFMSARYWRPG